MNEWSGRHSHHAEWRLCALEEAVARMWANGHIFCMGAHSAPCARKATTMSEDNNQVPNEVTQKLLFFIIALVLLVIVKYVLGV